MLDLVVMGPEPGQRWRRSLPEDEEVLLGRAVGGGWGVPWDLQVSREHAVLRVHDGRLELRCLERATNPAYVDGEPVRELVIDAGGEFVIGRTTFRVERESPSGPMTLLEERSFPRADLRKARFQQADLRLEVLSTLPDLVSGSMSDEAFAGDLLRVLLDGIPRAGAAAVMQVSAPDPEAEAGTRYSDEALAAMRMQWRTGHDLDHFRPSRRLIRAALDCGETILHVWRYEDEITELDDDGPKSERAYTMSEGLDWAFCTPIRGRASAGWCLYIAGRRSGTIASEDDLASDIRFSELLAQMTGAIREVRHLERQEAGLCQFFSPPVAAAMTRSGVEDILAPRECDITVLFCDLRGFSRTAEQSAHSLGDLLERCRDALDIMTQRIFREGGVVADFQGDAALGFWGWPLAEVDGRAAACRAALAIDGEFRRVAARPDHPLAGFRVGIGIAHGRAIAGKIGSREQAKVGVLGPVVNLGSRLEGLTKQLGVPIILDEATAAHVRAADGASPPWRLRRLGRVRPYGLDQAVAVSQLLQAGASEPGLGDDDVARFERAIDALAAGAWEAIPALLAGLPEDTGGVGFLRALLAASGNTPPAGWDGTVTMPAK